LSREGQDIEKILKALKIVVMDMKKRMDEQTEDFEGFKNQITGQDGEIQALSNMVNQVLEQVEGGAGAKTTTEGILSIDDEKLRTLEETLETTKNRLDQLEPKLEDLAISQQALASLEVTREGTADMERLEQLEAKLNYLENKSLTPAPGDGVDLNLDRLVQLESKFSELETAIQVSPSEAVDIERLAQLEAKIFELEIAPQDAPSEAVDMERIAQLEAKLAEMETKVLDSAPSEFPDQESTSQLEEKVDSIETKVFSIRGKLAEFEDMLSTVDRSGGPSTDLSNIITRLDTLERTVAEPPLPPEIDRLPTRLDILENTVSRLETTQQTPSSDLTDIINRLESLEAKISSRPVEHMPERELAGVTPSQLEVTTIDDPASAPSEAPTPTTRTSASKSVLTMKDRVLTIIEELVSCSAMQIAMKLQISTASIISDLRQLEAEGRITLSGDVETNPDVKLE